jgi:hypothetical protein
VASASSRRAGAEVGAIVVPEREVRLTEEAPGIRFVWTAA